MIVPGYEDPDATLSEAVLDARDWRMVAAPASSSTLYRRARRRRCRVAGRRPATTHWLWTDELQRRHPLVEVLPNRLFIDDGDILTPPRA